MSARRLVQHRIQRDLNTREVVELRQDNERLQRQVARLRKQIEKLEASPEELPAPPSVKEEKLSCPKCSSTDLGEVMTPTGKKVISCRACKKWRARAS